MSGDRPPVRSARGLAAAALMAGLTAIGAVVHLPLPYVPITLQPAFVCLAGAWLGARLGAVSQLAYLAAGLVGFPVFVGGGGLHYVLEPTFGYLLGFPLAAWTVGSIAGSGASFRRSLAAVEAGLVSLYLVGVPWLYVSLHYLAPQPLTTTQISLLGLAPLPKDLLVGVGIAWLVTKARRLTGASAQAWADR